MSELFTLSGRRALITGSAGRLGLGSAIARAFADGFVTGHNLVVDGGTIISDGN